MTRRRPLVRHQLEAREARWTNRESHLVFTQENCGFESRPRCSRRTSQSVLNDGSGVGGAGLASESPLESAWARKGPVGSNPTSSAARCPRWAASMSRPDGSAGERPGHNGEAPGSIPGPGTVPVAQRQEHRTVDPEGARFESGPAPCGTWPVVSGEIGPRAGFFSSWRRVPASPLGGAFRLVLMAARSDLSSWRRVPASPLGGAF
jgi:hypothetical protein